MTEAGLDALAERLDAWARDEGVSITENGDLLVVRQLTGVLAIELVHALDQAGLPLTTLRDLGGELERDELTAGLNGVQVQARLPAAPVGVERVLTLTAFADALRRPALAGRVWVRRIARSFETLSVRFGPWNDGDRVTPAEGGSDPRRVMRALGSYEAAEADLGRWLLVDPERIGPEDSPALKVWRAQASPALAKALCNEIDPANVLLFRGPPLSRFAVCDPAEVELEGFEALQRAARWTYLNAHEVEQRHGLMSAEIARTAVRNGTLPDLAEAAASALDGARIAYAFGVQQQSRETLKALSDLRKAVLDEAAKLTEVNRALGTAVIGAVFGGVGLLLARLTLPSNGVFVGSAALLLALVLLGHVAATIVSGILFVRLQRDLRVQWRTRLYAFLGPEDYKTLVEAPVGKAERGFYASAWFGGALTILVVAASMLIFLAKPSDPALVPEETAKPRTAIPERTPALPPVTAIERPAQHPGDAAAKNSADRTVPAAARSETEASAMAR